MGDFLAETAVEDLGDRRYRAVLHSDWMTWGPAGGYVAATALRAAGAATAFERPASFACQFLGVARFEAVDLRVETLRAGRRTEALRVHMTQHGSPILDASVWAASATDGLEHDYTRAPDVPGFAELKDVRELAPDRFDDAARALMLIDFFSWPATWPAHPSDGPSPWIAPNLDLHVRFHHDARAHEWLLCETRADLAAEGLIGTTGSVWDPDGRLIAAGSSQLMCRPRPRRFQ